MKNYFSSILKYRGKSSILACLTLSTTIGLSLEANAVNIIDSTYGVGAGSFELGTFVNNGSGYQALAPGNTTITGWTVGGPGDGIDWIIEPAWNADTGVHSVDLRHLSGSSIFTSIPTIVGDVYKLSFTTATVDGYANQGSVSAGSLVNQTFTPTPSSNFATQTFSPFTFLFTATDLTTQVRFTSTGPYTGYGPIIDSVSVVTDSEQVPIPEPLTILGAMTAAGFGASFKHKLAKNQKDKKN